MSGLLQMLTGHGARGCGVLAWLVLLRFCAPEEPLPRGTLPPFDSAFLRLSPMEVAALPLATHFTAPMGAENGALTYNARPFRTARHLGDDLNGIGGWNSDLGVPVHAFAAGRVVYTGIPSDGWGRMVIVGHRMPDTSPRGWSVMLSVYAHLETMKTRPGNTLDVGQVLGTVGTAEGRYLAHLHFELRDNLSVHPGLGYADGPLDRISPEAFLRAQRRARTAR